MTSAPIIVRRSADTATKVAALSALALSVFAFVAEARRPEPPLFVSVSIKSLIEEHMVSMIGREVSEQQARQLTEEYIASLEAAIASLSESDGVIVLAGEAVLGGGAPDFTSDIRAAAVEDVQARAASRGLDLPKPGDVSGINRELERLTAATGDLDRQLRRRP